MSITLVHADAISSNVTFALTNAIGDYILLMDYETGASPGTVSGFSVISGLDILSNAPNNAGVRVYERFATGADETVPVNSVAIAGRCVVVYRGVHATTPLRQAAAAAFGDASTLDIPAQTTGSPSGRAVAGFGARSTNTNITPNAPLVELAAVGFPSIVIADTGDTMVAALAAQNLTMQTSADWCAWSLMLQPAASASAGSLTATQAADTISSAGKLAIVGSLTKTQAADTTVGGSSTTKTGALSTAQEADTLSAFGSKRKLGTLTKTQAADTVVGRGGLPVSAGFGAVVGDRVYTVSATLYPDWGNQSSPTADAVIASIGGFPIGGFPFGVTFTGSPPLEIRTASKDFPTRADDPDLPSVFWDGRVLDPGSLSLSLPLVPVGDSAIQTSVGRVVLDNTDGHLDQVLDENSAVSQGVEIKAGVMGAWVRSFVTIAKARIIGLGMNETEATLELQDPVVYAQNLYPTSLYTGAGGATGDAELEGVVKPVVLGRVWNMSPVLINAVSLIFQVHDGAVSAITGVFDGGVALTFSANFGTYGSLAAATVNPGQYATCLAAGLIRVGGTPAFALTAHVDGHSTAGTTVRSIATWLIGQLDTALDLDVDSASFNALPTWTAGWLWIETFTFAEAISRFVGDAGYHWGADVNGVVGAVKLNPPVPAGSVAASFTTEDIMAIERTPLPAGFGGIHKQRVVRYRRNWTVQSDGELAATAVNRPARQREWKSAIDSVTTTSRNSIDPPPLDTSLEAAADAASLASGLLDLHGEARRMFAVESRIFGSSVPPLGDQVRLTYPRFGLTEGEVFRVVALDLRLVNSASHLLLWG